MDCTHRGCAHLAVEELSHTAGVLLYTPPPQVLDLKGSIRVLCRVRPLLEKEQVAAAGAPEPVKVDLSCSKL
jgi:hypothetical protein